MGRRASRFSREPETTGIRSMTHEGRGVADKEGKTVFVDGALPGEEVEWQRMRSRRNYDEARALQVLSPSPDRVDPGCAVFGVCGGCVMQHLNKDGQVYVKEQVLRDALERIGNLPIPEWLPPVAGDEWHYRRRARLGVRYVDGKSRVLIGFRERYKPYITDMQRCPVLVQPVADLLSPLADLIAGLSIVRELPQIEVSVGDGDEHPIVSMILRVLATPSEQDLDRLRSFSEAHNVWFSLQTGGLDSITGLPRSDGSATPQLEYRLDEWGLSLHFEPSDFIQVNADINRRMINAAIEHLDVRSEDRVLDLFSGIGNFSLPLATKAQAVHGVEGLAALSQRAEGNAARNNITNASFATRDLSQPEAIEALAKTPWDLILLDPARAGADAFAAAAGRFSARRIVYVSCHPGTLARDAGILQEQGFALRKAGILNMFPHTAHVESMAVFEPRGGQD
ncbi:MAG: 23S rRNA (uracil(1939)-C(5))-methyltransferase RlmD [Pseudomonadota bacterium]